MPISPPFTERDVAMLRGYAIAMNLPVFGKKEGWSLSQRSALISLLLDVGFYEIRDRKDWPEACLYPCVPGLKPWRIDAELFTYMKEHGTFTEIPETSGPPSDLEVKEAALSVLDAIDKGYELRRKKKGSTLDDMPEWILIRGEGANIDVWGVHEGVVKYLREKDLISPPRGHAPNPNSPWRKN